MNEFFRDFVLINVYLLLFINLSLVLFVFIRRSWIGIKEHRFKRKAIHLRPQVENYMMEIQHNPQVMLSIKKWDRKYVYQLMLSVAEEWQGDYHVAFDSMGFTNTVLYSLDKHDDVSLFRQLAVIKSPLSIHSLYQKLLAKSGETVYRVASALTQIPMPEAERVRVVEALLKAPINQDRVIELLLNLSPSIEQCLTILESDNAESSRIILLRYLQACPNIKDEPVLEKIEPYLHDVMEVQIASVLVVGTIHGPNAYELLVRSYRENPAWEVRATIARVLAQFPGSSTISLLKEMCMDEAWWVKFNAFGSLTKLGKEGLDAILDVALEANNAEAIDMAYQMLNADAKVHNTLFSIDEAEDKYVN